MQKNERADLFAKLAARTNSNWPCEDRHLPRERMRVQTRRWIGRSAGDANLMRLRRHFLTSSKGLLDPPKACYERRAEALRRGSVTRDAARNGRSIRPGFPAFADRLCITVDVDVSYAVDALLHRFGRIFVLFLYRFEERPKKRQRKKAPVHASKRRLHLDFPFFGSRGVTNGQSNGETDGECAENGRHRVLAQEEFRSLSSMTCLFFRLFPGIACRSRDFASRLPETLPRTRSNLLFAGWQRDRQRFIFHKIVAV